MANIKSSQKDAVKSRIKKLENTSRRSMMRTFIKRVRLAITSKDKVVAEEAFKKMQPVLDRCVSKGIIHKNKAARHKSIFFSQIKKM